MVDLSSAGRDGGSWRKLVFCFISGLAKCLKPIPYTPSIQYMVRIVVFTFIRCENRNGMDIRGIEAILVIRRVRFHQTKLLVCVRSVPTHITHPLSPSPTPHAHGLPSPRSPNDADTHSSSAMRAWLLLYGRCPYSMPCGDCGLIRGPHLP